MIIKWNAEHEKKFRFKTEGCNVALHFKKGVIASVPDSTAEIIKRKLSDAFNCGYCEIIDDKKVTPKKKKEKAPEVEFVPDLSDIDDDEVVEIEE